MSYRAIDAQLEFPSLYSVDGLADPPPDPLPLQDAAFSIFFSKDFRQCVASGNSVKKAQCIPQIAFSTSVGPNY